MDVGLMQRLIDAMATTEHRTIVSMGPLKDQMTLGPNMYGDEFLPQPSILPQCHLLITHGSPDHAPGDPSSRERRHLARLREFPAPIGPARLEAAWRISDLRLGAAAADGGGRSAAPRRGPRG
jgi:hypothetical protein